MREIKFRGQDFDTGEWRYGSYNGINSGAADVFIIYEKEIFDPVSFGFIDTEIVEKEVKEDTVGQYTGLKDKNGVEIYEGDIVQEFGRASNKLGKPVAIAYYKNGFYFDDFLYSNWDAENVEVIGNIYENPELLNSKEASTKGGEKTDE